ncbi:MAG: MFS transporter [Rhodospirillaceae bacterium]|nr:MFS transporter [Rhodospirillaceae bacterium]|tara:strand:- start:30058 stop:31377 length:1320 start_codon:yes stop_codon:yes gene_type:complete
MVDTRNASGLIARTNAINILNQVLSARQGLEEVIAASKAYNLLEQRDRAFVRLLVASTLRRLGQIDALLREYLKRPLPKKAQTVRHILRLGVTQIIILKTPAHAVVDTSVRLCEQTRNPGQKGLVNAILRKISKEGATKFNELDSARLNTPKWLWESWLNAYGEDTCRAIADAHLEEPPLVVSVKAASEDWAKKLDAEVLPTGSLKLTSGGMIDTLPGYDEGTWWVQDTAAALPARILLESLPSESKSRLLDLCAAPGGKTAQLAASGATVTAVDRSKKRLSVLRENLERLKLSATVVNADATTYKPANMIDGVLLDAPCTATGTMRRHPDIGRTKRPGDVERLSNLQKTMLENSIENLVPGGVLVYSVCSLQLEEGPDVVNLALSKRGDIKRLPIDPSAFGLPDPTKTDKGDLRTLPCHFREHGGLDGFYIARLQRAG